MALRERVGTGVFVILAIGWYLIAPQSPDCTDMQTGETLEGCQDFFTPFMTYFCALPPLVLAVLVHTLTKGGEQKPSLQHIRLDVEGRVLFSEEEKTVSQQEQVEFFLRMGMNLGGLAFVGAYAFIFIVGLLAIPQMVLCGMMGSNCSDSDFLWAENSIAFGYTVMKIGFWVFFPSAVGTFVLRNVVAETPSLSSPSKEKGQQKVVVSCPSCEKKLRFPADYTGDVQCPNCTHIFTVSNA